MIVNFNEAQPKFLENKPIVNDLVEEANRYTINHDLRIPVEDQRFRATPAKVNYKIPVYGYEYVDVQEEGCDPCCGCEIDIYDEINLNGWGNYRPVKKDEEEHKEKLDFKDVMNAFNRKYGKGTLVHPGMIDPYAGKNIIKLADLDRHLGLDPTIKSDHRGYHDYNENIADPSGWDYKVAGASQKWN